MSKIGKYVTNTIEFPDSGWTLSIVINENKAILSLHWRNKVIPTHQVECDKIDIKQIFE